MDFSTLGGNLLGTVPFGDIVLYFTPLNLFLFAVMLISSNKRCAFLPEIPQLALTSINNK